MLFHQANELATFGVTSEFQWSLFGETVETGANLIAAGSVYYVLVFTRHERALRGEIDASKTELESVANRLELIFDNVNDGILLIDTDANEIIEANHSACEMLRYAKDELVGKSPYKLHPHQPEQYEALTNALRADGGVRSDTLSCRRQDGSRMPADVSASRTTLNGTSLMLVTIRDNTEQEQYRTQADLLSRVLRHNLRNDMTVVMGRLGAIETTSENPGVSESAAAALKKCSELLEVSEQTRKLSDILDTERQQITGYTDLVTCTEKAAERVQDEHPQAQIELLVPETAPIEANEDVIWAIEQIVDNAVVHTEAPSPTVEVSIEHETVSKDGMESKWTTISVSDYGPGIPEDEVTVLRDNDARSPTEHGSGLGLWITRQIVDIFDGELEIERPTDTAASTSVRLRFLPANSSTLD
jgi:PAS domain S-box-containing protein